VQCNGSIISFFEPVFRYVGQVTSHTVSMTEREHDVVKSADLFYRIWGSKPCHWADIASRIAGVISESHFTV
jgi:hypothetical protein